MPIVIDFETRCRTDIKAGASRYSLDAEILCLSFSLGGDSVYRWYPGQPRPFDLFDAIEQGEPVFAHNATFEIAIWKNVMVAKHGWPEIPLTQWRCTMSEAMACGLPASLEEVANSLQVGVQKDMAGRRLMLKMAKPRKPTLKDKSEWHDKPADHEALRAYCDQDVRAEMAVHAKLPRLNPREIQVYHYDQRVNQRGIMIDRELAESALYLWNLHSKMLNAELKELTNGEVETTRQVQEMRRVLSRYGCHLDALDKQTVSLALQTDIHPVAKRLLEIRQELALSSVSKYEAMLRSIEPDNRVRGCLQYHGAQTGRWAGRLIQVQNFPRGTIDEDSIEFFVNLVKSRDLELVKLFMPIGELLSSLLRSAIVAPPGKKLLVTDFAAIEARGLAWAAKEEWMLEAFRQKRDVYKEMASSIYNKPVNSISKGERFFGKTATLGCGYSMGAPKLQLALAAQGIDDSLEFCETIVKAYREKNRNIYNYWYATEKAALRAIRAGGVHEAGPFKYFVRDNWLFCRMPAGRNIAYFRPHVGQGEYGLKIGFYGVDIRGKLYKASTYSGKLVENNIQAVCRDVLVDAMSRLERRGYPVIMHIHDEIVCEVDEDFGSVEEMEAIMCEVPSWCQGFPIAAEGFESRRYRK